jgi:hypothetical protein
MMRPQPRRTIAGANARIRRAREVHVNLDVPVRILHLQQRPECLDSGICKQDVGAIGGAFYLRRCAAQSRQIALIQNETAPFSAGRIHQGAGFLKVFPSRRSHTGTWVYRSTDINSHYLGSALRECNRCSASDSSCRSGDHG